MTEPRLHINKVKLFGKWTYDDVRVDVHDRSLRDYIAVNDREKFKQYLPHTAGRYNKKRFRKALCPIVERLTNSLMMHGRNNGKKMMAVWKNFVFFSLSLTRSFTHCIVCFSLSFQTQLFEHLIIDILFVYIYDQVKIVQHAFEIIYLLTNENPIQVLVKAIVNSGPREDSTRVGSAGIVRRQAVDVSPLRRVNTAIYLLTTGAREAAFRNIKTIAECLADELINAAKGSSNSYAVRKKDEIERVAKSNR
jgi:small subunit ribosomal protein S5e